MKLFYCSACQQTVFFANTTCTRCGYRLGYDPSKQEMVALSGAEEGLGWYIVPIQADTERVRFCENAGLDACNWLLPVTSGDRFCLACRHNRTVPALVDPVNCARWRVLEQAKHRLFHTFLRLKLPIKDSKADPERGLAFDFLADLPDAPPVMTGHTDGLITVALREADDVERERMRVEMGEYYRTVLGHFRHETGHYIWDLLVRRGDTLDACRTLFGDDRASYAEALERHYSKGPPENWRDTYVSAYATMHPWEDFAETWAHYLHMVDALESAQSYGLRIQPGVPEGETLTIVDTVNPFETENFARLATIWLPMIHLMNSLNRSMGLRDSYPFVLTKPVLEKMAFMHALVRGAHRC